MPPIPTPGIAGSAPVSCNWSEEEDVHHCTCPIVKPKSNVTLPSLELQCQPLDWRMYRYQSTEGTTAQWLALACTCTCTCAWASTCTCHHPPCSRSAAQAPRALPCLSTPSTTRSSHVPVCIFSSRLHRPSSREFPLVPQPKTPETHFSLSVHRPSPSGTRNPRLDF